MLVLRTRKMLDGSDCAAHTDDVELAGSTECHKVALRDGTDALVDARDGASRCLALGVEHACRDSEQRVCGGSVVAASATQALGQRVGFA